MQLYKPNKDRFMRFVQTDSPNGCWLWAGYRNAGGYGRFSTGRHAEKMAAHRAAWELFRGEIPAGMQVLHKCDVPACVNPDHLFIGSVRDNVLDMFAKGRANKRQGEYNGRAKLNAEQVTEIRIGNRDRREVAAHYGVSVSTVDGIRRGTAWRNHG